MEEKPYGAIDQLFKRYQLNNMHFTCQCKTKMDLLCTNNCGYSSLHCHNTDCKHSNQKHKFCRNIKLQGLTELLQQRFKLYEAFMQRIQKVEQEFIVRIRKQREKAYSNFMFREFEDEQIGTLENLFIKKNVSSVKGIHIEEVYKRLLLQKVDEKKNDQLAQQFKIQLEKLEVMLSQISVILKSGSLLNNSKIIERIKWQQNMFISECLSKPKELNLLFRASENQFSSAKFHQLCDGIPNLLVLVKTEFGKVVGGFNSIGWKNSNGQRAADTGKKCFIFSVTLRQKMDLVRPEYAIYNNRQYGPCFGDDIKLSDKCNTNRNSSLNFPYHYNFTAKPYNQKEQTYILFSGSSNYSVAIAEYEVFLVVW